MGASPKDAVLAEQISTFGLMVQLPSLADLLWLGSQGERHQNQGPHRRSCGRASPCQGLDPGEDGREARHVDPVAQPDRGRQRESDDRDVTRFATRRCRLKPVVRQDHVASKNQFTRRTFSRARSSRFMRRGSCDAHAMPIAPPHFFWVFRLLVTP